MQPSEIAKKLNEHLNRMEADPDINRGRNGKKALINARAKLSGEFIHIAYHPQLPDYYLKLGEALGYLQWLEAGHAGYHIHQ